MKLYLAGPVSDLPQFNYPAFEANRKYLEAAGYDVLSPTDNDDPKNPFRLHWTEYMRMSIRQLTVCDGVAVLSGIESSKGGVLELLIAQHLNMPIQSVAAWVGEAREAGAE